MKYPDIAALISKMYAEFESISEQHEEFTDTDVRETVFVVLNHYFTWGKSKSRLPICYLMFSHDGDLAVSEAVNSFLLSVDSLVEKHGIPVGEARLDLLQDESISTPNGQQYDDLIGYLDQPLPPKPLPEYLFKEGEYDDNDGQIINDDHENTTPLNQKKSWISRLFGK